MTSNSTSLVDIFHHVRRFWGTQTEDYNWIKHEYETFLVDVGLEGNIFTRNYSALEFMAEHSWWKHTWRLCYTFDCELVIDSVYMPLRFRERDQVIMELFINSGLWSKRRLIIRNRVRRFKNIHFFSEILCSDRKTIDPRMLTNNKGHSSRDFLTERPTSSALALWRTVLRTLPLTLTLSSHPLGPSCK